MKEVEGRPTTFKEILGANNGDNFLQRGLKTYIKPKGNPETTVRVLEALQVDQVQKIPKAITHLSVRLIGRHQSNYAIKDSSLSSLIDYGAKKSAINEFVHLGALACCVGSVIADSATGSVDDLPYLGVAALVNTYLILAQRYSRARIEKIVNNRLRRGDRIGHYAYEDRLNLRLPE